MTPPILEFQDIQVRAGPTTLLNIPSFRLDTGALVSLLGPNGSGKTTFLHTAAFLQFAASGHLAFAGNAVTPRNAVRLRHRISIVFQDPLLFNVDVMRNVVAGIRFQGVGRTEAERRGFDLLTVFGVAHLANRKPHGLSGGEAARVALARAFANDPDLLLMDEPFSALDAETRTALIPELRERLEERGAAAILVTHDIAEAFAFAPRLALLDNGMMIADGNIRDLTLRPPSQRSAALLGVENVIPGRLVTYEHGFGSVEIVPGTTLLAGTDGELLPETAVEVAVQATMIRLLPCIASIPDGWNAITGRVTSISSQPGWDLITLFAAGSTVCVRETWAPGGSRWQAGDVLQASFPPDAAWIIPEAAAV